MEEKPNYYAIIPANVRYDNELSPNAKLLYGEITALCNKDGSCYATNNYFASLYNVSIQSISKWINLLVKKKYINHKIEYKIGTKQILNRYLSLVEYPIKEKFKDNNTSINNNKLFNNNLFIDKCENLITCEYEINSKKKCTRYSKLNISGHYYCGQHSRIILEKLCQSNEKIKFNKPTLEDVKTYCQERNNNINAEQFIDYYESNGWKVGRNPMKDWKACIRTWERNKKITNQNSIYKSNYEKSQEALAQARKEYEDEQKRSNGFT